MSRAVLNAKTTAKGPLLVFCEETKERPTYRLDSIALCWPVLACVCLRVPVCACVCLCVPVCACVPVQAWFECF
jgi:hypothetical protein